MEWDYEIAAILQAKIDLRSDMEDNVLRKVLVSHDDIWATKGGQTIQVSLDEEAIFNPNGPRSYPYMDLRGSFSRLGTENQKALAKSFTIPLLWDRIIDLIPVTSGNFINNKIDLILIKTMSGDQVYEYLVSIYKEFEG